MLLKKWVVSFCVWISKQLKLFSRFLVDFFFIFQISPLTIISLLLLYYIVWISDQGQDLIITINNNARNGVITQSFVDNFGPVSLYSAISILAVMNWYFPKFFYVKNLEERKWKDIFTLSFDYLKNHYYFKHGVPPNHFLIPRLFGILTFFIPAFGMLKALNVFGIKYPLSMISPGYLLIGATLIILQLLNKGYFVDFYKNHKKAFNATAIALFFIPFLFGFFNKSNPLDLTLLFLGLLFYGILFAMITPNRGAISRKIRFLKNENISLSLNRSRVVSLPGFCN